MGFPDWFVLHPMNYMGNGGYEASVYKQTGKAIPAQFCEFVAKQIKNFIKTGRLPTVANRILIADPLIEQAKDWYAQYVGYSNPLAYEVITLQGTTNKRTRGKIKDVDLGEWPEFLDFKDEGDAEEE